MNNKEDAKDILQNVFIKISQQASTLSNEQKIKSWVYTITKNSIIDYYRTRTDTKLSTLVEDLTEEVEEESITAVYTTKEIYMRVNFSFRSNLDGTLVWNKKLCSCLSICWK